MSGCVCQRIWLPDCRDSGNGIDNLFIPCKSTRVIEDISQDECLAHNPFLRDKGIHFYADAPVVTRSGKLIGSLRILDTRLRKITDQEKDGLQTAALPAAEVIELRTVAPQGAASLPLQ
jgi:GAF domain-containing protein